MNSREPHGSGILGHCKLQWIIYLSATCVLCVFVRSTPLKSGLVGKESKKLEMSDCTRDRAKFCSLSFFIQYLILVISGDFKGSDSYGWCLQDHNNTRTATIGQIKRSSFRILSLVMENRECSSKSRRIKQYKCTNVQQAFSGVLSKQFCTLQQSVIAENSGIDIVFSYYHHNKFS